MPKVEIEEGDLLQYQAITSAVRQMQNNPEAKKFLDRANLEAFPNRPDHAALRAIETERQQWRKDMDDIRGKLAEEKEAREKEKHLERFAQVWETDKASLKKSGWTEDGIAKAEKHAEENGIPSLRAAANDYLALNPPPSVAEPSWGNAAWEIPSPDSGDELAKYIDDQMKAKGRNEAALSRQIQKAISEARQGA